jgi:hypothetical protein
MINLDGCCERDIWVITDIAMLIDVRHSHRMIICFRSDTGGRKGRVRHVKWRYGVDRYLSTVKSIDPTRWSDTHRSLARSIRDRIILLYTLRMNRVSRVEIQLSYTIYD